MPSFFAECERDEHGRCKPGSGSGGSAAHNSDAHDSPRGEWEKEVARLDAEHAEQQGAYEQRQVARDQAREKLDQLSDRADGSEAKDHAETALQSLNDALEKGGGAPDNPGEHIRNVISGYADAWQDNEEALADAGASDRTLAKLRQARERAVAALSKKAETYAAQADRVASLDAALKELDANEPPDFLDEPDLPDEPDTADYEDTPEGDAKWQKDHDAWERETEKLTADYEKESARVEKAHEAWQTKRDKLAERIDPEIEKMTDRLFDLTEALDGHQDKLAGYVEDVVDNLRSQIDAEDEADEPPDDPEYPDEPDEDEETDLDEEESIEDDEPEEDTSEDHTEHKSMTRRCRSRRCWRDVHSRIMGKLTRKSEPATADNYAGIGKRQVLSVMRRQSEKLYTAMEESGHLLDDAEWRTAKSVLIDGLADIDQLEREIASERRRLQARQQAPLYLGSIIRKSLSATPCNCWACIAHRRGILPHARCPNAPRSCYLSYRVPAVPLTIKRDDGERSVVDLPDRDGLVVVNQEIETDDSRMTASGILATSDRDRQGDIIECAGVEFEDHRLNPVVLWDHSKWGTLPIGITEDESERYKVKYLPDRDIIVQTTHFAQSYPVARQVYVLVRDRIIRANSIAVKDIEVEPLAPDPARGHFQKRDADGHRVPFKHILRSALAEVTWASLPANPDAVMSLLSHGKIDGGGFNREPLDPIIRKSLLWHVPQKGKGRRRQAEPGLTMKSMTPSGESPRIPDGIYRCNSRTGAYYQYCQGGVCRRVESPRLLAWLRGELGGVVSRTR